MLNTWVLRAHLSDYTSNYHEMKECMTNIVNIREGNLVSEERRLYTECWYSLITKQRYSRMSLVKAKSEVIKSCELISCLNNEIQFCNCVYCISNSKVKAMESYKLNLLKEESNLFMFVIPQVLNAIIPAILLSPANSPSIWFDPFEMLSWPSLDSCDPSFQLSLSTLLLNCLSSKEWSIIESRNTISDWFLTVSLSKIVRTNELIFYLKFIADLYVLWYDCSLSEITKRCACIFYLVTENLSNVFLSSDSRLQNSLLLNFSWFLKMILHEKDNIIKFNLIESEINLENILNFSIENNLLELPVVPESHIMHNLLIKFNNNFKNTVEECDLALLNKLIKDQFID